MKTYLDEMETDIKPAPAPDPVKTPTWKKVLFFAIFIVGYLGLVAGFLFSDGGLKLIFLISMVVYVLALKPLTKVLRRLLKLPDFSD